MGRAPCCEKVGLKRGRWTAEEDQILTNYIQANGQGSWRSLPQNAGLLRCGKSCRLRWINYLRGDLKRGNFSVKEESLIVKLHASFGNRWSLIASHMPGRTDNEIKNYWNSHLSRKLVYTTNTTQSIVDTPPKRRRCGRTSRWAMSMKKNKTYHPPINNLQDPIADDGGGGGGRARCDEKECHEILCQKEEEEAISIDDEVLSFHEFVDTCLMEPCGDHHHNHHEQRETAVNNDGGSEGGRDTCTADTMVSSTVDSQLSKSDGNHQLHYSCSSISSCLDSVMEFNREEESSVLSMEHNNENLLTWLWQDEDWENDFQIVDPDKHNAMLYWFLS